MNIAAWWKFKILKSSTQDFEMFDRIAYILAVTPLTFEEWMKEKSRRDEVDETPGAYYFQGVPKAREVVVNRQITYVDGSRV